MEGLGVILRKWPSWPGTKNKPEQQTSTCPEHRVSERHWPLKGAEYRNERDNSRDCAASDGRPPGREIELAQQEERGETNQAS